MKTLLIAILIPVLSFTERLHEDTILKVDKEGEIIGLPKNYQPAKFDFDKKYLRIKNNEIVFPKCLDMYFEDVEIDKIYLSASWYHVSFFDDPLPPYLYIEFPKEESNNKLDLLRLKTRTIG